MPALKIHPRTKFTSGPDSFNHLIRANNSGESTIFNIPFPKQILNDAWYNSIDYDTYLDKNGEMHHEECGICVGAFFKLLYAYLLHENPTNAPKLKYRLEHFTH
jgi:hypothetical protein